MPSITEPFARFLETFQHANALGSASSAALFADTFLAGGPDGAKPVSAAAFAPALDKRKQLFDSLGSRPAELVSVDEILLDTRYTLARTCWRMAFLRPDHPAEEVFVNSTFLLDLETQRILVYLAHQDIFDVLRQRGILPD